VRTSDGNYLIKPYSTGIVETTFVPKGETPIRRRTPWCWRRPRENHLEAKRRQL
jgi:hypothetical protein